MRDAADAMARYTQNIVQTALNVAYVSTNGDSKPTPVGLTAVQSQPFNVEFDGPARDADSHHVFPYTFETLVNDQEKFDQILWWYFAGHPVRITKAMRIPLGSDPNSPSLFVGYSGPGVH
jgi:hypothetical protein